MAGVGNYEIVEVTLNLDPNSTSTTISAPTGKRVFFGYPEAHAGGSAISFTSDHPSSDGKSWIFNYGVGLMGKTVTFRVICASMGDCE